MKDILLHLIPAVVSGFVLQTILHELGHLLGGLITGWRLLYIQIYRLVIKRGSGIVRISVVEERGFKCIMCPSSINSRALLYTVGGCITNLVTGLAGFIIMLIMPFTPSLWIYLWCFSVFGVALFLVNGTGSIKRVCNDKACYKLLKEDNHNRICHNGQLMVAKHLMEGLSYRNIGEELICLCPDLVCNDIQAYQTVLEYYYYLDKRNHMMIGPALNKIRNRGNISGEVLRIIELEEVYLRLVIGFGLFKCKTERSIIIQEDIDKYIRKGDIHSLRVKAVYDAYQMLRKGELNTCVEMLDNAIDKMKSFSCVYEGERIFCVNQLRKIKGDLESHKTRKDTGNAVTVKTKIL